MSSPPVLRWRVDCRKQRGIWRSVLTEAHDLLCQALTARFRYRMTEDWDDITVTPAWVEPPGKGPRLVAAGGRRVALPESP